MTRLTAIPIALVIIASSLLSAPIIPATVVLFSLTFEGLQPGEQVLDYYNGGLGGNGSGPGSDFGVSFTPGLASSPGSPIGSGLNAVLTGPSVVMSLRSPVAPENLLSFYRLGSGTVTFHSGPNATGLTLATFPLLPLDLDARSPAPYQSVTFTGNGLIVNMITVGTDVVIPEPGAILLVLSGVILLAIRHRYR